MKNQKQDLHEFVVRGFGRFPIDMLRYDHCWPKGEEDSAKIENSDDGLTTSYDVSLQSGSIPTIGRWNSFSFDILC